MGRKPKHLYSLVGQDCDLWCSVGFQKGVAVGDFFVDKLSII